MEDTIYLKIVKSYASSATEYTSMFQFKGVSNLLGFLNESIEQNDDIFTGLTFKDPGDEQWTITIWSPSYKPYSEHTFTIKTWSDIDLVIKGMFIGATYDWL